MAADEGVPAEKRVTWTELFFDLVFVFALTQVSELVHADHTWAGLGRALIVFVPIYWAWVATSIHANIHDVDNPVDRLGVFAVALCGLFMALEVPRAYGDGGVLFGITYTVARIVLLWLVLRGRAIAPGPSVIAVFVTGPLLVAGGLLPDPGRMIVWGVAAALALSTPALMRQSLTAVRFDAAHLVERYGLLLIIALGESILAIGVPAVSAARLDALNMAAVAAAFVFAAGLWWAHFVFSLDTIRRALSNAEVKTDVVRRILSYGHLALIAGVLSVAVGASEVVAEPRSTLSTGMAGLLFGGCALYVATFVYTRWSMFREWATIRLTATVAVLALLPLALLVPALAALSMVAVVVVLLNVAEHVRSNSAKSPDPAGATSSIEVDEIVDRHSGGSPGAGRSRRLRRPVSPRR